VRNVDLAEELAQDALIVACPNGLPILEPA